jgi:formylglycine-generating enzyme required for sulfatase activity
MRQTSFARVASVSVLCISGCGSELDRSAQAAPPTAVAPVAEPPGAGTHDIPIAAPEPGTAAGARAACPDGMVLVEGAYCPNVRETCKKWMEDPAKYSYARCAEYAPSECAGPREPRRFCIDRDEHVEPGQALPAADVSWTDAKKACEAAGRRLCLETEWQFACEGEQLSPYPYGRVRDNTACNFEQPDLYMPDGSLRDLREPPGKRPGCVSPFGVRDMTGNVDEWTSSTRKSGYRSILKGGYWSVVRNRCRPTTRIHFEGYSNYQQGFRCCTDVR